MKPAEAGLAFPEAEAEAGASGPPPGELERDGLKLYLDEIGRIPMLTHPQLIELAKRSRSGDSRARRDIIHVTESGNAT